MSLLPLIGPVFPDFFVCNPNYGSGLSSRDCVLAAMDLGLEGNHNIVYHVGTEDLPRLPVTFSFGGCFITVDVAGPSLPGTVQANPDQLRQMAAWVISQCVVGRRGLGGYTTFLIHNMLAFSPSSLYYTESGYLPTTRNNGIDFSQFSPLTAFLTVTVSGEEGKSRKPGDTDPMIPIKIGESLALLKIMSPGDFSMSVHEDGRKYITLGVSHMGTEGLGSLTPWWQHRIAPITDEMAYECDAALGSPSEVDCSQIEWNQLMPAASTLSVGPGNPTFLHSNTCYLAISATINMILTWVQIRAAVSSLLCICVDSQAPVAAKGGRAYWQPSTKAIGRRRKRQNGLSGLNALPPHANITVFKQQEPYNSPATELKSCTWTAIEKGGSVSNCGT